MNKEIVTCSVCDKATTGFMIKEKKSEPVCFSCVSYSEAVTAISEGKRIRWRYKKTEPKTEEIAPEKPNPLRLVEFTEYQKKRKAQKALEKLGDEILGIEEETGEQL